MRLLLALLLLCSAATAQTLDFVKPLSAVQRAPISSDMMGRLFGAPGFAHLHRPVAVAADGAYVYLFDAGPKLLYRFNRTQETLQILSGIDGVLKGNPSSIVVVPDHSLYLADPDGRQVIHLSFDGQLIRTLSDTANLARPTAVSFDLERDILLAADGLYDHILGFNHEGWLLFAFGERGQELNQLQVIVDMARGPEGLYLVDRLNPYIKIYSLDGRFLYGFSRKEVNNPVAIAVDRHERVYVADGFDDTIKVYEKERYIGEFGGTGSALGKFRFVTDLYIDQYLLYVADSMNGRVQVYVIDPYSGMKSEEQKVIAEPLPEPAPIQQPPVEETAKP